jgi:TonB family protein
MLRPSLVALGLTFFVHAAVSAQAIPEDAGCRDAAPSAVTSPIGEVVDSVGFASALARLRTGRNERADLARITFRPDGEFESLEVYGESGGASEGRAVERALRPYLLDQPATGDHRWHWIVAGPGAGEVSRLTFTRVCEPTLLNAEEIGALVSRAYADEARRPGRVAPRGRVVLQMRLGPDGRPRTVRVLESSRHDEWDEVVRGIGRRARFTPGRVDDRPVMTNVTLPFAIPGG